MARIMTAERLRAAMDAAAAQRDGRRSLLVAGIGLLLLVVLSAIIALMPGAVSDRSALSGALLMVRMLHLAGMVFAISALVGAPHKAVPALGLLANALPAVASGHALAATAGVLHGAF